MKTYRRIIGTAGCTLAAGLLAVPAASASPLLSGYGGPGQGNQAILGSTLLNGPGSGGSSGGAQQPSGSASVRVTGSPPASTSSPTGPHHAARHAAGTRSARQQGASSGPAQSSPAELAYARAERSGAGSGSGTLGLSVADFLYAGLVLVGLVLMGVVTRWLIRATPVKGHG